MKSKILIFYDAEFTQLTKNTDLISIGCIDQNGREFYAEITDYDKSKCNKWIENNVIDNLLYISTSPTYIPRNTKNSLHVVGTKSFVKKKFKEWLGYYDDVEIQFVSDVCHYDFVLLIDLLADTALDLPQNIVPVCHDINQDIARKINISEKEAFDLNREELAGTSDDGKHNSLKDAKDIKIIFNKII